MGGILGSALGAGIGAIGSIFGGLSASKAMKKLRKNINAQREANKNWYDQRYNEDATQRADAQAILNRTEETIRARNKAAAGSAAVMGGTEESVAATKEANAKAQADAAAQIAVNAESRKDAIEQQFQHRDAQLQDALNNIDANKAYAVSQAIQGVTSAAGDLASEF